MTVLTHTPNTTNYHEKRAVELYVHKLLESVASVSPINPEIVDLDEFNKDNYQTPRITYRVDDDFSSFLNNCDASQKVDIHFRLPSDNFSRHHVTDLLDLFKANFCPSQKGEIIEMTIDDLDFVNRYSILNNTAKNEKIFRDEELIGEKGSGYYKAVLIVQMNFKMIAL